MNTVPSGFFKDVNVGVINFSVFKFPSLDSTNVFLKSNHTLYPDFSVILAENQTAGKGRFERKWQTAPGKSLTFSVKIPLRTIPTQNWCNITQLMALSVSCTLEELNLNPTIRWPNDVLINNDKICGILGELVQNGTEYCLVLGVGLNINECKNDFANLDRGATSLFIQTGKEYQPEHLLNRIVYIFGHLFEKMETSGYTSLVEEIGDRLYKSNAPVKVISGDTEYTGMVIGLTNNGLIQLKTESGIVDVLSGEITSRV